MAHGHFSWNELMTWEPQKAMDFYGKHLGWTFDPMDMPGGTYYVAKDGEEMVAGIFPLKEPEYKGMPSQWFAYIDVDDIDRRAGAAKSSGGTIMREPFDVPGVGRIAMVQAPDGSQVGWMTPAPASGAPGA